MADYGEDAEAIELLANVGNEASIRVDDGYIYKNSLLYVPEKFRKQVIKDGHHNGHPRIEQTQDLIKNKFYWGNLLRDAEAYVKECTICQRFKVPRKAPQGLMNSFNVKEPLQMVALDFFDPLPETANANQHVLIGIDGVFSKFVFAQAVKSTSAKTVIKFIKEQIIGYHGVLLLFLADNASCFKADALRITIGSLGAELQLTTPHHHQGNAVVERVIQSFKDKLAMAIDGSLALDEHTDMTILGTNAIRHKTTKYSPYELLFGRRLRLPNEPINVTDDETDYYESLSARINKKRGRRSNG